MSGCCAPTFGTAGPRLPTRSRSTHGAPIQKRQLSGANAARDETSHACRSLRPAPNPELPERGRSGGSSHPHLRPPAAALRRARPPPSDVGRAPPQQLSGCEPTCEETVGQGEGECGEIRMVPPPFGILGMWGTVRGYREGTSQEICCSGFEYSRPKGDTRNYSMRIRSLIPTGDTLQIVCTSATLASREGDCVLLGTSHLAGRFEAQNGAHDVWLSDES